MALARNLRTLIVLGTVASLMVTGAIWAHQAVAQAAPECPPDWPNQQYAGPLREKDHGRIQYEDYHTDADGQRWYIIRSADSNGYTTIRAYPASDGGEGYQTDSPDRVCYLIVREPGAEADAAEPRQVEFPREREPQRTVESISSVIPTLAPTHVPTLAPTPTPQVVPDSPPELSSLELDGEIVSSNSIVRSGLSRGQEVQIILRISDADGGLAYLALVAEDGTVLDRVDCENGVALECTLASTVIAPSTYSATLQFRAVAVDSAGVETELATFSLTTRSRPRSNSGSGGGSSSNRRSSVIQQTFTPGVPATLKHSSGAEIEIPEGATTGIYEDDASVTLVVSIEQVSPPPDSVLDDIRVFDISITDGSGRDVNLRSPVTITLPYTLPADKNAADVAVLHWSESDSLWQPVLPVTVDETGDTVTFTAYQLSSFATDAYYRFTQYLKKAADVLAGGATEHHYDAGIKYLVSFHAEQGIPIPMLGIEIGSIKGSLIIDLADITRITREGEHDYITVWFNLGVSLGISLIDVIPVGVSYSVHFMDHDTHQHDPPMDASLSALTFKIPTTQVSAFTVNSNGNIHPADIQLQGCLVCIENAGVDLVSLDANAFKAELDVGAILDVLDTILEPDSQTTSTTRSVPPEQLAAEMIGAIINPIGFLKKQLLFPFTYFDSCSPEDLEAADQDLFNSIIGVTGGYDRTGDGVGDLVFPPTDADDQAITNTPLKLTVGADFTKDTDYKLDLVAVSDGWTVTYDEATPDWTADQDPEFTDGSTVQDADFLYRVEFTAKAATPSRTHWLVTSTAAATEPGTAEFDLIIGDETVHQYSVVLVKDRDLSDLAVSAHANPPVIDPGTNPVFEITVSNNGPDLAANATLRLTPLEENAAFPTIYDENGTLDCQRPLSQNDVLECPLTDLAADSQLYLRAEYDSPSFTPTLVTIKLVGDPEQSDIDATQDDSSTSGDDTCPLIASLQSHRGADVSLIHDPAISNNLASLRPPHSDSHIVDPNCTQNVFCITTREVQLTTARQAAENEFPGAAVCDWNDNLPFPRRQHEYSGGKSLSALSLLEPADFAHLTLGGQPRDSDGRWYYVYRGERPQALQDAVQVASLNTGDGYHLVASTRAQGRVLAYRHSGRVHSPIAPFTFSDAGRVRWYVDYVGFFENERELSGSYDYIMPYTGGSLRVHSRVSGERRFPPNPYQIADGPELRKSLGTGIPFGGTEGIYTATARQYFNIPPNPTPWDRTYVVTAIQGNLPLTLIRRIIVKTPALPVITSDTGILVEENAVAVATLAATDEDTEQQNLLWSIIGGDDADSFVLTSTGELSFDTAKDFEDPDDANQDGTYVIEVAVADELHTVTSEVFIILTDVNEAPTANAGVDQTNIAEDATVTLDGTASSDQDAGDTLTYEWTQTGGPNVTLSDAAAASPTFTAPTVLLQNATLEFTLQVTDGGGLTDNDTVSVTVLNGG